MAYTGPQRPPHFSNSRRQPQAIPSRYVANTNTTIEDIDASPNKGSSGLLTILLISLTALILIIALSVGGYFLFRHGKVKHKNDGSGTSKNDEIVNKVSPVIRATDSSDESSDSIDERPAAPARTKRKSHTLSVNQIYFKNMEHILYDEFVGYSPKTRTDMISAYDSLLTLQGIAKLFGTASGIWTIETGNPMTTSNLCHYFRTRQTYTAAPTISKAVDLCGGEFKLTRYHNDPLQFHVFSPNTQWHGVILQLQAFIFQMDNGPKMYALTNPNLRRISTSNIPSIGDILQNEQLWKSLPWGTYHALFDETHEPNHRLHVGEATRTNGAYDHHCDIEPSKLADLYFVALKFTLTISHKKHAAKWQCKYQDPTLHFRRRRLSDVGDESHAAMFSLDSWDGDAGLVEADIRTALPPGDEEPEGPKLPSAADSLRTTAIAATATADSRDREEVQPVSAADPALSPPADEVLQELRTPQTKPGAADAALPPDDVGAAGYNSGGENEPEPGAQRDTIRWATQLPQQPQLQPQPPLLQPQQQRGPIQRAKPQQPPQPQPQPPLLQPQQQRGPIQRAKPLIRLDMKWWNEILTNRHTQCTKLNKRWWPPAKTELPCDIVGSKIAGLSEREELANSVYYGGCGYDWAAKDNGRKMIQVYDSDVFAADFKGILESRVYPLDRKVLLRYKLLHTTDADHKLLETNDVPFWECQLLPDGGGGDMRQSRALMAAPDEHTSDAWHQQNMYVIIASTMLFIVIGVQSFYWLSNSY